MTTPKYDFQFTERDAQIIAALARYRFLTTSQVRRLIFAGNTSPQSARRRLKYLRQGAFLCHVKPPLTGKGQEDSVYFLGKAGIAYAHNMGFDLPKYGRFKETSLPFLSHAIAVSEFRVALELALHNHPTVQLHRSIADFELKTGQKGLRGQHRFRLFDTLDDPTTGESVTFYPDAVVILSGKGDHAKSKRLYFVEIDKGTETLKIIDRKLRAYDLASQSNMVAKFGAGRRFRVLFQVPSPGRQEAIKQAFADHSLAQDIWITTADHVTADTVLQETIWQDLTGERRAILRQGSQ